MASPSVGKQCCLGARGSGRDADLTFLGAALINRFAWVFYFFGLLLILTAGNMLKGQVSDDDRGEDQNFMVRLARRFTHTSEHFDGDRLTMASLLSKKGRAKTAIGTARRHARDYLDLGYTEDNAERERIYGLMVDEFDQIESLGPKYRGMVRDESSLMKLVDQAGAATRRRSAGK